jgi:hypothetical protein
MIFPSPIRLNVLIMANCGESATFDSSDFHQLRPRMALYFPRQAKKKLAAFGRPWFGFERGDFRFTQLRSINIY